MDNQYNLKFENRKNHVDIDKLGAKLTDLCEKNKMFLPNEKLSKYHIEIPIFLESI
jgi:hypothetical protein